MSLTSISTLSMISITGFRYVSPAMYSIIIIIIYIIIHILLLLTNFLCILVGVALEVVESEKLCNCPFTSVHC